MSLANQLRYHLNVSIVGNSVLRLQRWQGEWQMSRPGSWQNAHIAPPVAVAPRLKELISRHYLKGQYAHLGRKVAWVTSGAPVEFLVALGYFVLYPENHAAVCGIRRMSESLCTAAEDAGYSPDLCSYARTDIGSVLTGKTPVGKVPRPDVLVCCTNICQTVLFWYRVLAHHFNVPLIVIDTPFLYTEATERAVAYVKAQLEDAVIVAERVAGRSLGFDKLKQATRYSRQACELWMKIMECGQHRPAPITAFDEFFHMAPIVEMRGEAFTVDYYAALLAELEQRKANNIGAVTVESKRLLWDNLPVWHRVRWLSEMLAERQVALVASTYTNAWGELAHLVDPERPMESAATVYLHPILNRGTGHKLKTMRRMVDDYQADGVILHSDRSCKPYSIGQIGQRNRLADELGAPALLLEADHNDPRAFSNEQVATRLSAFLELLEK
ncbi:MAG: 2-hydroxyacyl-CoA dehydratase [Candidatus Schekmanbacteria bacterium]|nr:2-hydroxyacyl-CoA dehydratase [Candidatus Schekmanbacteria bacterium]